MVNNVYISFLLAGLMVITYSPSAIELFLRLVREHGKTRQTYDLTIGILSARSNFITREVIRNSWMRALVGEKLNNVVNVKFILGDSDCDIHPDNRLSVYGCHRWETSMPEDHIQATTAANHATSPTEVPLVSKRLKFTVMHSVVLKRLGILSGLSLTSDPIVVNLIDNFREVEVTSVSFNELDPGRNVDGYRFQPTEPILLHKGFEGTMEVNFGSNVIEKSLFQDMESFLMNSGGVILIENQEAELCQQRSLYLQSFYFSIHHIEVFRDHVMQQEVKDAEWAKNISQVEEELRKEMDKYDDILLVNVVDVYRNLPSKILHFHHNIQKSISSKFIMKTDDDCFVDIEKIYSNLQEIDHTQKLWIGQFRADWFIETYGKWAEKDYKATSYPIFACGSGNIVSEPVSKWIGDNYVELKSYQGEDVSMGIWLSAIGPHLMMDNRWVCNATCVENAFVIPELEAERIKQAWLNKVDCNNPCMCNVLKKSR